MSFIDLNTAETGGGASGDLIPDNTTVRAILTIRPGGAGEGGWMKMGPKGLMFDTEWTVVDGPYARRKIWSYMSMSENAAPVTMRSLRAAIEGHYGILPDDMSEAAQAKRKVSVDQLNGIEACILIGIEPPQNGHDAKNKVKAVVAPGERRYIARGAGPAVAAPAAFGGQPVAQPAFGAAPAAAPASGAAKPAWAS